MAKKATAKPSSLAPEDTADETAAESPQQEAEESPKVRKAADAVRRAEAELEKAQQLYHKVRQEATDRLKAVREKTMGDLIDGTLNLVKKHPGPGVIIAALIGFFLGRLFRR
jgi:ElaB/YqjD/DUF883 family membrane-anchored ribosome-binding protein